MVALAAAAGVAAAATDQNDDEDEHYCCNREEDNRYKVVLQPFRFALDYVRFGSYFDNLICGCVANRNFRIPQIYHDNVVTAFNCLKALAACFPVELVV